MGELIEDRADALWQRADIEALRVPSAAAAARASSSPSTRRPRGGAAPAASSPPASARTRIAYVIADWTRRGGAARRMGGARRSASTGALDADALVAEVNQGGDMVEAVIREVDAQRAGDAGAGDARQVAPRRAGRRALRAGPRPPRRRVSRSSRTRCADFGPDGLSAGRSPDRLDALVWAITALMLGDGGEPRVRGV